MANENILEIGATINLSTLLPDIDKMAASVTGATAEMSQGFAQLGVASEAGAAKVVAGVAPIPPKLAQVRASASGLRGVFQEFSIGVVEGMQQASAAISSTAQVSTVSTGIIGRSFTFLRSLVQQFSIGVVEGMSEVNATVVKTSATTAASTAEMGSWWERLATTVRSAALSITGSLSEMDSKVAGTAAKAGLGVGTMSSAFAGLSSLLGAGIAVGFAAHFLDEAARMQVELRHLSEQTDIAVTSIAGLRAITQQAGEDFGPLSMGLIRMQKAQVAAVQGNKMMELSFHNVGISMAELKTLQPEQLFFRLVDALNQTENTAVRNATALTVFSRAGRTLPPLLKEIETNARAAGVTTEEYVRSVGKSTGVTDESAAAAAEWTKETAKLSQQFQSFLIPVIKVLIDILPRVGSAFHLVGLVVIEAFRPVSFMLRETLTLLAGLATAMTVSISDIPKVVTQTFHQMSAIAKGEISGITQNLKDGRADWDAIMAKEPPKTIFQRAKEDLDALFKKPSTDLSEFAKVGGGGKDQLAKFREELDQMRDAQTGFHELSKAEEADFWKTKLDIARGTPALYRQVYHEYVAAERAARKESLGAEVSAVEERVQAERTGSLERIIILQEEAAHLKEIGAEETNEYRRIQQQLSSAQRENTAENEREFSDRLKNEVASTKSAAEQLSIIRHAQLQAELLGFSTEGASFKALKDEELAAERRYAEEQRAISGIDADAVRAHEQANLDIRRSYIATEASLGLITNEQRVAQERATIAEEIALERQALEEKAALYRQDPVEYERVQKQLLALTDRYNKLMAQSENEELKQRLAGWQRFEQQFTGGFSAAVAKVIETGRGFGNSLAQTWNQMVIHLASALAAFLAKWLLTYAAMEVISHSRLARDLVAHIANIHAKIAAQTAANTQQIAQATATNAAMTAGDAAFTASHVAAAATRAAADTAGAGVALATEIATNVGKVTSEAGVAGAAGFASAMVALPFPVNIAVAPGVMASSIATTLSNLTLASAERGAVLGQDTLVAAHAREMILPPPISTGLQNLIAVGGLDLPPALSQNLTALRTSHTANSNTTNNHYNSIAPKIAVTVNGTSDGMKDLHNTVVKTIKRALRNGQLNFENA